MFCSYSTFARLVYIRTRVIYRYFDIVLSKCCVFLPPPSRFLVIVVHLSFPLRARTSACVYKLINKFETAATTPIPVQFFFSATVLLLSYFISTLFRLDERKSLDG